jgi:hypothetical protein
MKRTHLVALAVAAAFFSVANAADAVTAKLQAPLAAPTETIAGGAVFECAADTCTTSDASADWSVSGCRDLARSVGVVASFGVGSRQLSADKLAACNKAAKPTKDSKDK